MITRSELAIVCRRLESELEEAGFRLERHPIRRIRTDPVYRSRRRAETAAFQLTADGFAGRSDHQCTRALGSSPSPDQARDEPRHSDAAQA